MFGRRSIQPTQAGCGFGPGRFRLRAGLAAAAVVFPAVCLVAAVGEPVNLAEAALVNVIDAARNVRLEPANRLARGTDRPV
ncbi:MAG: hypothetical protein D6766_06420, partial [Verrucomicrobia bacterium]